MRMKLQALGWRLDILLAGMLLAAAYGTASWAIDSGSLWAYLMTFVCLAWSVLRMVSATRKILHERRTK